MKPNPLQLEILLAHMVGPRPFFAGGSRSTKVLLAHGLLSFRPGKVYTRITKRGRALAQRYLAALPAPATPELHP